MTDAGFFRGTSTEQDNRFSDKNKKLMKTMSFADNLDKKVDMRKCKLDLMRPFITDKLNAMMPLEDEVIIEYVFSQLEDTQFPNGKEIQMMLTGFLGKTKAKAFMQDLWAILLESQDSPLGVPKELIELKKSELEKKKQEEKRINESVSKNRETIERSLVKPRSNQSYDYEDSRQHRSTTTTTNSRWNSDTMDRRRSRSNERYRTEMRPPPIVVASSTVRPPSDNYNSKYSSSSASIEHNSREERRPRHRSSSRESSEHKRKHRKRSDNEDDSDSDSSSSHHHRKSHKSHKHKKKSKKHKRSVERSDREKKKSSHKERNRSESEDDGNESLEKNLREKALESLSKKQQQPLIENYE